MSRNLMRMALIMAATAAYAQDDIFGYSSPRLDAPSGNIPSDKQKCQPKAQHEFTIKGVKIMAASKKDAIKKFNHRKKIKRRNKLEYIPGDLVMVKKSALQFAKDKIFKVISSLSGGFLKVVMLNDSSTTYSISNNAIRPIPLTPEILEKNGWKSINGKYALKIKNANYVVLEFTEDGIYTYINENTMLFTIKYIHELQHLLFGLGLNSEMEV